MKNTVKIQNLKCGGCANTIVTQLSKLDGISEVQVDNDTDEVSFTAASENDTETVKTKLSHLGYPIDGDANSLPKKAKSFVSCAVGRMTKQD
ncbi:heavy-metal-associated domain-containing protein [Winogradskyella psychrotolerans]|uniref:heavy-metal-associated domain-containing protein n=1 Tax=Winogradskyella psychrotolerans TaxID=1344585 RepID=UPI001C065E01|nr:heavy metal-associated domain-containing protein [Winogradskyella psychrotolerans]MBU2927397.1 heavy-metal-associated domain-containing protein [Winogradskyella psychrotolerans]